MPSKNSGKKGLIETIMNSSFKKVRDNLIDEVIKVPDLNRPEADVENIQRRIDQAGVPSEFSRFHDVYEDYHGAIKNGYTSEAAERIAIEKAKGRWLDNPKEFNPINQ